MASTLNTLVRGIRGRCPRCGVGKVRQGMYGLVEKCPHCQARLERSAGESTGAMMLTLSSVPLPALLIAMWLYSRYQPNVALLVGGLVLGTIGAILLVHRYARGAWLAITHLSGGLLTDEEYQAQTRKK